MASRVTCKRGGDGEGGMNRPDCGQYAPYPLPDQMTAWVLMNANTTPTLPENPVPSEKPLVSVTSHSRIDEGKLQEFVNRAMTDLAGGYAGVMVSLGRQLGLYQAMAGAGPLTPQEVAGR